MDDDQVRESVSSDVPKSRFACLLKPFSAIHHQTVLPVCAATWILCVVHIVALIEKFKDDVFLVYGPFSLIAVLLISFIPVFAWPALIALSTRRWPRLQRPLQALLIITICFISLAAYKTHFPVSFSMFAENLRELFYIESIILILGHLKIGQILAALILGAWLLYASFRGRALCAPVSENSGWKTYLIVLLLSFGCLFTFARPANDMLYFGYSIFEYYIDPFDDYELSSQFPYQREHMPDLVKTSANPADSTTMPHVFIIAVESFNAQYLDGATAEGKPYMPFLQDLRKRSFSVEQFYGNSVQTCRGHLSTLASILPSVRGKTFRSFSDIQIRTLADILGDRGYSSTGWKAAYNKHFDNMHNFLCAHGFDRIEAMTENYLSDVDAQYLWKWGARDKESYRKLLSFLDQQGEGKPQFAFHATITTHYPFDQMPQNQRYLYPKPRELRQNMANSMYLVDQDLKYFFEELAKRPRYKNSLVIITGDHSWPTGEHGITINGNGYYEEFFKIPFIMYWPGEIEPQQVPGPFSQIDIAPTLCDVLNIDEPNHMLGQSMFAKTNSEPIYLIQPYAGTYLMAIKDQKKYVYHMQTKTEIMHDLKNDPLESANIFPNLSPAEQSEAREWIRPIKINQYLLKQNRIWPAN